jgi:hypothetical protein
MLSYLYYRLYKFFNIIENHLTPEGIRIPEYLAMFAIVFLFLLNMITMDIFIHSVYGFHIILTSISSTLIFVLIIIVSMYVLLLRKKRYVSLIRKYASEMSIIYVITSITLLILVA